MYPYYGTHKWQLVPELRTERRRTLDVVRTPICSAMLFDKRYQNIDTGKFDSDRLETLNSMSWADMMEPEVGYVEYLPNDFSYLYLDKVAKEFEKENKPILVTSKEAKKLKSQEIYNRKAAKKREEKRLKEAEEERERQKYLETRRRIDTLEIQEQEKRQNEWLERLKINHKEQKEPSYKPGLTWAEKQAAYDLERREKDKVFAEEQAKKQAELDEKNKREHEARLLRWMKLRQNR